MKRFVTVLVLISMIGVLLTGCSRSDTSVEESSTEVSTKASTEEATTEETSTEEESQWEFVEMTSQEEEEAADIMLDTLDRMKHDNTYIQTYVGEGMANVYIYNKNGEVLFTTYDGSYFTIFRDDGLATIFADEILTAVDMDVLTILEGVATVAKESDNTKIYNAVNPETSDTDIDWVARYRVVINDYDDLKDVYSAAGDEYSRTVVDGVKEAVGDTFQMSYYYTEFTDGHVAVECGIEENGADALVWYFDGYHTIKDWELSEDWYSDDFQELSAEKMEELAQEVLAEVKQSIVDYAEENGLELETIENTPESSSEDSSESLGETETSDEDSSETLDETETSEEISEEDNPMGDTLKAIEGTSEETEETTETSTEAE